MINKSRYSLKQQFLYLLFYLFKPDTRPPIKLFLVNFVIATAVVIGLYFAEDLYFFKEKKDFVLDWVMYWNSDFVPTLSNQNKMQRMELFEIDNNAFQEWGSPVITPRDKLKALIEQADKGGAHVIAVDLELSWWSDGCIHVPGKTPSCSPSDSRADEALAKYLETFNQREDDKAPILILTRVHQYPLKDDGQLNDQTFRVKPPSFLDEALKVEKNVFWSSTFFEVDSDRVRRRWQLASLVCEDDHLTVVPSMQLLVALAQLYATDNTTREAANVIRAFKTRLNDWAKTLPCDATQGATIPRLCQQQECPNLTIALPKKSGVSDQSHVVDLAGGRETERVVYRFAPADSPKHSQRSLIDKENALDVLAAGADVDSQIVFIGATHYASGDQHPVPIRYKEVDGVYVVMNAVDTLLRFGQFKSQDWLGKLIISICVIVVATFIFSYYGIVRAVLFSSVLVGLGLFFWSGQALHHGIGVDLALPMLTIQIVQIIRYTIEYSLLYLKREETGE